MPSLHSMLCIGSYLLAIVAANGLVTVFGQSALPFTAFILIPFDLMARDVLHERWKFDFLWTRMIILITAGSALSFVSSIASAEVALASAVSFMCTGVMDVTVYSLLDKYSRVVKMNGSNLASACVDSLVFPYVAFGSVIPWLSATQTLSKFIGGFVWTAIFLYLTSRSKRS